MSLTWNYSSLLQNEFPDYTEEASIPPRIYTSSFVPLQSIPLIALCTFILDIAASQGGTLSKRTQTFPSMLTSAVFIWKLIISWLLYFLMLCLICQDEIL